MRRHIDANALGSGRRAFFARASALGAACLLPAPRAVAADPPPETSKVRLVTAPVICTAPARLAEDLLRLEGFTQIEYVNVAQPGPDVVAAGQADFTQWGLFGTIPALDAGDPVLILAGVHAGCQELFANERVRAVRDLKGKRIACPLSATRTTSPSPASSPTSASIRGRT